MGVAEVIDAGRQRYELLAVVAVPPSPYRQNHPMIPALRGPISPYPRTLPIARW